MKNKPTPNQYVHINEPRKLRKAVSIPEPRLVTNRPLKLDRAMQQAAERAKAHQPKFVSMTTKVQEHKK